MDPYSQKSCNRLQPNASRYAWTPPAPRLVFTALDNLIHSG